MFCYLLKEVCSFFKKDRKGVYLDGRGGREYREGVGRGWGN